MQQTTSIAYPKLRLGLSIGTLLTAFYAYFYFNFFFIGLVYPPLANGHSLTPPIVIFTTQDFPFALLLFLGGLYAWQKFSFDSRMFNILAASVFILFAYQFIYIFDVGDFTGTFRAFKSDFAFLLSFIFIFALSGTELRKHFRFLIQLIIWSNIVGILAYFADVPGFSFYGDRYLGFSGSAKNTAFLLAPALIYLLNFIYLRQRVLFHSLLAATVILGLIITGAFTVYFLLLISLPVHYYFLCRYYLKIPITIILLRLAIFLSVLFLIFASLYWVVMNVSMFKSVKRRIEVVFVINRINKKLNLNATLYKKRQSSSITERVYEFEMVKEFVRHSDTWTLLFGRNLSKEFLWRETYYYALITNKGLIFILIYWIIFWNFVRLLRRSVMATRGDPEAFLIAALPLSILIGMLLFSNWSEAFTTRFPCNVYIYTFVVMGLHPIFGRQQPETS